MSITLQEKIGLAQLFSLKLHKAITAEEMRTVLARNNAQADMVNDPVCHSHDFCDANMVMFEAWQEMFGGDPDTMDDADLAIWSEAWTIAKAANFFH